MDKSSFQIFRDSFESALVKAHKSILWIDCFDYDFIIDIIKGLCDNNISTLNVNNIRIWNNADMLERDLTGKVISGLTFIENAAGSHVLEGKTFTRYNEEIHHDREKYKRYVPQNVKLALEESITNFTKNKNGNLLIARISASMFDNDNGRIIASLQDFVYHNNKELEEKKRTIMLIASNHFEVFGLEHICEHLSLPLPAKKDIQDILGFSMEKDGDGKLSIEGDGNPQFPFAYDFKGGDDFKTRDDFMQHYEELIDALYGMYRYDIVELLQTLISESPDHEIQYYFKKGKTLPARIKEVKKQMVKNSGLLEVIDYEKGIDREVEDIDNLKEHLKMERDLMSNQVFLKSKLPKPKGILLVGAPGCGKSASAKAAASILKLDLYRLNIGDLLGHKYGQSENQFSEALRTADASAPCVLWIDEIEKAFAGAGNSQNNDDTLTHIVGRFLTWMQEHKTLVYLVATANDLSDLKPEMKRKGRWDEIFYLVYPDTEGRKKILNACLKKYDLNDKIFPTNILFEYVDNMDKMSGAEIESLVINVARHYLLNRQEESLKEIIDEEIEHGADLKTYNDYIQNKIPIYKEARYKPASKYYKDN
jgi:SpoVK/Ycf46/Vps4 family AAA+-type ATPase